MRYHNKLIGVHYSRHRIGIRSLFVYLLIPAKSTSSFCSLFIRRSSSNPSNTRHQLFPPPPPRLAGRATLFSTNMSPITRSSKKTARRMASNGAILPEEEEDTAATTSKYFQPKRIKLEKKSDFNNNDDDRKIAVAVTPDSTSSNSDCSTPPVSTTTTKKKKRSPSTPRQRRVVPEIGSVKQPPDGWEDIYSLVEELRQDRTAPCDHSGCEALPDREADPKQFRFQVLMSLMLSSQTKDAVVGDAIRRMQKDNVLSVNAIYEMPSVTLNQYINKVGFHNNKTKYIKQAVEILKDKYDGDVPSTAAEMMELSGVGPKMAYICENVCWDKQSGIGIDTHMHRLFKQLKWVTPQTKTPEQTRVQLEAWLPRNKWRDVNLLWVGFGQEVQQDKPKLLRKAIDCSRPVEALKLLKRCGLDYNKEGKKLGLQDEIKSILQQQQQK